MVERETSEFTIQPTILFDKKEIPVTNNLSFPNFIRHLNNTDPTAAILVFSRVESMKTLNSSKRFPPIALFTDGEIKGYTEKGLDISNGTYVTWHAPEMIDMVASERYRTESGDLFRYVMLSTASVTDLRVIAKNDNSS